MSLLLPPKGSPLRGLFSPMDLIDAPRCMEYFDVVGTTRRMRERDPAVQSVNWLCRKDGYIVLLATDGDTHEVLWSFGTLADAGIVRKPTLRVVGGAS
jgi:hypothetical protein